MKKIVLPALVLSGAMSLASFIFPSAGAAELRVKGMIVPDACVPTFSDSGVVDYGPVSSSRLGAAIMLSKKTISLSVSCSLPSRVAIRLIDNHDSATMSQMQAVSAKYRDKKHLFGLGTATGTNAGGYVISFESARNATPPPSMLESESNINATRWTLTSDSAIRKNVLYSWDTEHKTNPSGTLNFQTTLGIQAIVENSENLQGTQETPLKGSATFELLYL